jgi:hypothetical protein
MKLLRLSRRLLMLAWLASFASDIVASPAGTAFTYQGRLNSAGQPANGYFDLKFTLYNAASGGGQVGSPVISAPVAVTNGSFSVLLEFGAVFNGDARWVEIGVRTNGSLSPYVILSPRQPLTPTPYAVYAPNAGAAATAATASTANNLAGALSGDVTGTQTTTVVARVGGQIATDVASGAVAANLATSTNTPDSIVKRDALGNFAAGAITASSFTGNGAALTGLNATNLATGTVADGRLSGNVALRIANQTFTGSNTFAGVSTLTNATNVVTGTFSGNGGGLTNLNASLMASGTLPGARLLGTYSNAVSFTNHGNSFSGNGGGLTNLNAGSLASGTIPSARLSGTYSNALTFTNSGNHLGGNGAGLTNLNASSLASGTVPNGRLSGTYSNALAFTSGANSFSGNGSGLTAAGLVQATVLNVNCSGSGVSFTTAFTKVADIGAFTKLLANSTIEVTFNGRTYVTGMNFGAKGAVFELRVDNAATLNGRARASYRHSEAGNGAGVQTSITGIFTGLPATTHTVSMWVQAADAGGSGMGALLDLGCLATDHVVVKELK